MVSCTGEPLINNVKSIHFVCGAYPDSLKFSSALAYAKKIKEIIMAGPLVQIKKLDSRAKIPEYKKTGDAGFDLHCIEDTTVPGNKTALLHTGLAFCIPQGYEMQVRMRSGAALNSPLIIANAPGTVDSGYRGEICIIARNTSNEDFMVAGGERIAQGVIAPVANAILEQVDKLPPSERGTGGFGSTGKD